MEVLWGFDLAANPIKFPDELPDAGPFIEGAKKAVAVNDERDTSARAACLRR